MAGISCHFLLSPPKAPAPPLSLYSRPRPAAVRGGLPRPGQVRRRISCCLKDDTKEECATSKSATGCKDEETSPSRRKCLACLCAVTLISASGPTLLTPNGLAADMQKAVCRNCGGGGAIICLCPESTMPVEELDLSPPRLSHSRWCGLPLGGSGRSPWPQRYQHYGKGAEAAQAGRGVGGEMSLVSNRVGMVCAPNIPNRLAGSIWSGLQNFWRWSAG
ncbi:unnamed protein product [Alopecurus aequalis]